MKLKKIQTKLGIPYFSIHKLRHYFASKMSELGIPEADILKMGGWETDHIMKKVYRHSLQTQAAQRRAMNLYNDSIFNE
jgi:integrase